jgi:uracil-DNA glycosylase
MVYMTRIEAIRAAIIKDNEAFSKQGYNPIFRAYEEARIVIIGQAPGIKTQLRDDVFRDESGDRLRAWMGIDESMFYDSKLVAVLPMDFYYPGKALTGDKPPRKDFADKWHPQLLACMPKVELIILIGVYAQKHYLGVNMKKNLTETVKSFEVYLPTYFPLVHPSPLNRRWMAKNPWFELEVLPVLKKTITTILD